MDVDLIILNIFEFLYPTELVYLKTVCKQWNWIITDILKKRFKNRWEEKKIKPYLIKTGLKNIQCCCIRKNKIYIKENFSIYKFNLLNNKVKKVFSDNNVSTALNIQYNGKLYFLGYSSGAKIIDKRSYFKRWWEINYQERKYSCINSKGKHYYLSNGYINVERHFLICGFFYDKSSYTLHGRFKSLYIDKNDFIYVTQIHNFIIIYSPDFSTTKIVILKFRKENTILILRAVINNYFFVEGYLTGIDVYNIEGDCITRLPDTKNLVVFNDMLYCFDNEGNLLIY
jgi:hypothetical protein